MSARILKLFLCLSLITSEVPLVEGSPVSAQATPNAVWTVQALTTLLRYFPSKSTIDTRTASQASAEVGHLTRRTLFGVAAGAIASAMDRAKAAAFFDGVFARVGGVDKFVAQHNDLQRSLSHRKTSATVKRQMAIAYAGHLLLLNAGVGHLTISTGGSEFELAVKRIGEQIAREFSIKSFLAAAFSKQSIMDKVVAKANSKISEELTDSHSYLRYFFTRSRGRATITPLSAYALLAALLRHAGVEASITLVMDRDSKELLCKLQWPEQTPLYLALGRPGASFDLRDVKEAAELTPAAIDEYETARPYLSAVDKNRGVDQIDRKYRGIARQAAPFLVNLRLLDGSASALCDILLSSAAQQLLCLPSAQLALLRKLMNVSARLSPDQPYFALQAARVASSLSVEDSTPENRAGSGGADLGSSSGESIKDLATYLMSGQQTADEVAELSATVQSFLADPVYPALRQSLNVLSAREPLLVERYGRLPATFERLGRRLKETANDPNLGSRLRQERNRMLTTALTHPDTYAAAKIRLRLGRWELVKWWFGFGDAEAHHKALDSRFTEDEVTWVHEKFSPWYIPETFWILIHPLLFVIQHQDYDFMSDTFQVQTEQQKLERAKGAIDARNAALWFAAFWIVAVAGVAVAADATGSAVAARITITIGLVGLPFLLHVFAGLMHQFHNRAPERTRDRAYLTSAA